MSTATAATKATLKYENIAEFVGARILNTKDEILSGELEADFRELLEQRGVLVLPEVHFTDDEQVVFTKQLGEFMPELAGQKVFNISLDKKKNPNRDYLMGSLYWHIDGTMNQKPIGAAVLSSKVLPTWGGNTEFCNTYAAYDALPQETKDKIEGLRVKHAMWNTLLYYTPEPTKAQLEEYMAKGEIELPLVWTHKSGRKSLVLGNSAVRVLGLEDKDSALLLHGLREFATSEPFHYSHEWKLGDTVIWDNTGTMHRAMPYDPDCGRLLHRTKTSGTEPIQ